MDTPKNNPKKKQDQAKVPEIREILQKDDSFLSPVATTWLGIVAFIVAIPILNSIHFPFISSIGVLMLIGLAFWALGRKTRAKLIPSHPDSTASSRRPGLRIVNPKDPYAELKMDDQAKELNQRRLK